MLESPDAVLLYIPLMKDLGMQWREIKNTPRHELIGLLSAHAEYSEFHSMDGYSDKDISEMAKDRPEIRPQYARYLEKRRKYQDMLGEKKKRPTFRGLI
jgi:hypothetical protein|tara:strand:- start:963 stop:1259 length:297 start_codon:yes stop_codon:yes gene_type:complete